MDRFYIIANELKDIGYQITQEIQTYIEENGKECIVATKDTEGHIVPGTVPEGIECAIVLGGDGTLIRAARELKEYHIPLIGVNMGTLGYLTEIEVDRIEESLDQILSGHYMLEDRMMLDGIFDDGGENVALNDIVLSRKGNLRIIHFNVYVNGTLLNSYEADGIVISTPTGSTAYNLSAGGPIVEPTASLIVITPICSHALNTSSIVLSAEDEIRIEIGEGRHGRSEEVYISFDGTDTREIVTGQTVTIRRSAMITKLMKLSKVGFLEILRRKMKGN